MSSHHIVREEQEPALYIDVVNYSHWHLVEELLEWSPTVIVADTCAELVMSMGVKVDVVIANGEVEHLRSYQSHLSLVSMSQGSHLAAMLEFLRTTRHQGLNIICSGENAKGILEQIISSEVQQDVVLYEGLKRSTLVRKGKFIKWVPKGIFEVWSPAEDAIHVSVDETEVVLKDGQAFRIDGGGMVLAMSKSPFVFVEELEG